MTIKNIYEGDGGCCKQQRFMKKKKTNQGKWADMMGKAWENAFT